MSTTPVFPVVPPYTPELLSVVQDRVENFLKGRQSTTVLEFGSGWSTIWLAKLCTHLYSFEDNQGWYMEVAKVLAAEKYSNYSLYHAKNLTASIPHTLFDVIYIDCVDEQRIECLKVSLPRLKDDGLLILDDTHWDMLQPAFEILKDWGRRNYEGMHIRKMGETCFHKTTIFTKRLDAHV